MCWLRIVDNCFSLPRKEYELLHRSMTLRIQISAALIAFSPSVALYAIVVSKSSLLIVIAIAAAGFWLLSISAVSFVWTLVPLPTEGSLILGAAIQEGARLAFVRVYREVERSVHRDNARYPGRPLELPMHDASSSVAAGFGFGTFHVLVISGGVIASSGGQATTYEDSCPRVPVVLMSAYFALAFFILDVLFTAVIFHAERRGRVKWVFAFVLFIHAAAAVSTAFPCWLSIPLLAAVVVSALLICLRALRAVT